MRRQRDAAFTDEIITNIKQFQPDTDCEKPDEMTDSHAKRKTCNSLVTGQKNVGYLGDTDACRDCLFTDTQGLKRPTTAENNYSEPKEQ